MNMNNSILFESDGDMVFAVHRQNEIIQAPFFNISLKEITGSKEINKKEVILLKEKFILNGEWIFFICPCGCNQIGNLKKPTIINKNPLTIKESILLKQYDKIVKFRVEKGEIHFLKDSESHMMDLPINMYPVIH